MSNGKTKFNQAQAKAVNYAYRRLQEVDFRTGARARADVLEVIRSLRQLQITDEMIIKIINVSSCGLNPLTVRKYLEAEAEQSESFMEIKDAFGDIEPFTFRRPHILPPTRFLPDLKEKPKKDKESKP